MTKASKSPVTREVDSAKYGALVVEVTNAGLMMRRKGTRTTYGPLQWDRLFEIGAKMTADHALNEKRRRPRVKRGLLSVGAR